MRQLGSNWSFRSISVDRARVTLHFSLTRLVACPAVDEKLYSRQLYVMGHEAQRKMMASRVLLIGGGGLGVEVAKNCILAGIHSILLCDPTKPTFYDMGANFYLTESDVTSGAKGRAAVCEQALVQLNPYVQVSVASNVTALDADSILPLIPTMTCVVVTVPLPKNLLIQINEKCRELNASFIYATTPGAFAQVFCDFGPSFVVTDKDGNPPATSQIASVLLDENPAVVKVLEDHGRHGLEDGDHVTFGRLQGCPGLVENQEYPVKVTGPFTFELVGVDLTHEAVVGETQQGYITQVKQPVDAVRDV